MAQPYDRLKEYHKPGDYILLTSKFGKGIYIAIEADEPLGQVTIQMTNIAVNLPARAARAGAGLPVPPFTAIDPFPVPMDFLNVQREDRVYQVRPTIFAVNRDQGDIVNPAVIPPLVMLEWEFPAGTRCGGSDIQRNVVFNGIPNNGIGGFDGGRIPANMIYTRSDPSEMFDMHLFFKTFPSFRLINWTRGIVGGAGVAGLQWDWYLGLQGRKYIFRNVTPDERQKLDNREMPYDSIPSPGGISETLMRRD